MYVFLLNGENVELAREEILALSDHPGYELDGRVMTSEAKFDFERLAYSHKVLELIGKISSLSELNKINLQKYYKQNFSVRIIRIPSHLHPEYNEKKLGSMVWELLKNPKVDLTDTQTKFVFIFTQKNIFVCKEIIDLDKKSMKERDAKFRPGFHPSTMNSGFARAIVNLSSIKPKEILMDPFCGVGGILLEAGSLNCKLIGYDINEDMIDKCRDNFKFYKTKNFKIKVGDALKVKGKVDAIVTDLPYGRHSSLHGKKIDSLYDEFVKHSLFLLKSNGKLVIVMPSSINVRYKGFSLKTTILHRIHKGLTRKILVLEKN